MSLPSDERRRGIKVRLPNEARSRSRTATRALDVMELFGSVRRPLRAIEVSQAFQLNPSTTNQLLKTMVDSGHLVFDARLKTYLPSMRLARFGGWMAAVHGAEGRLRSLIRGLNAQLGMLIAVSAPNDLFMQIIECVPRRDIAERGLRVSLFGSALGSAYLSTLDLAEIEQLAYRARIAPDALAVAVESVARVREAGFVIRPSEETPVLTIAMPLPLEAAGFPAILSLSGPVDEVGRRTPELVVIMRQAASNSAQPS